MATATELITLALHNAGITGIGQAPQTQDLTDGYSILTQMMDDWQLERTNVVNPTPINNYPDLTSIVIQPFGYDNAITWGLTARYRAAWMLPPDEAINNLAKNGYTLVQSINRQQSAGVTPVAVTTVVQLLQMALRMAGRSTDNQRVAPDSLDMQDAFAILVQMMAQWQRKRWLVPSLAEIVIPSTGAALYQLGPPGAFSMGDFSPTFDVAQYPSVRTDRIEDAFVRLSTSGMPVDWPLYVIRSREEYNRLSVKSLSSFPCSVFYDAAYPIANLHFWPVPPAGQFEMHVFIKATLQQFATIDDQLTAPPEYVRAMRYGLALDIADQMGGQIAPGVEKRALAALNTIRMANIQIPTSKMPAPLAPYANRRGGYASFFSGGAV